MRPCDLPTARLPPAPLSLAVRQALHLSPVTSPGFSLFELLAITGATTALAAVAWGAYARSVERQTIATEADTVAAITRTASSMYASRDDFGGLTQTSAVWQGAFPARMVSGSGVVSSAWGGSVRLAGVSMDGGTNNGFTLTYSNVPSSACASFATSAGSGFYEVTVRPPGNVVGDNSGHAGSVLSSRPGRVDPALAASRCSNALNTVAFTYVSATTVRASCGASGPIPPLFENQTATCPTGSNGLTQLVSDWCPDQFQPEWAQTRQREGICNASGTIDYGAWEDWTPTHTCADQCIPVSSQATPTRTYTCLGANDLITTPGRAQYQHTGPQQQTVTTSQTCNSPIGPLSSPPTVTSTQWLPTYACAPPCVAPAPRISFNNRACPTGQIDIQAPYTPMGITDTVTRTYMCPLPVGLPTFTDSTATQNHCAPQCVAPPQTTATQTVACTPPATGNWTQTQTTTWSCAAPTGSATTSTTSPWSPVIPPVGACTTTPACTHPQSPQTSQYGACPANPTGWPQSRLCTEGACPPGGGATTWSCGNWSPPTQPASCTPTCAPVSTNCPSADRAGYTVAGPYDNGTGHFCVESKACPVGDTGSNTSYRTTYNAAAPSTCANWGPWIVYSAGSGCSTRPPTCTWAPPPNTTPACPSGGNQSNGTWQHAASCPDWNYVGGSCPAGPPACSNPAPASTQACPAPFVSTVQSTTWTRDPSTCVWSNNGWTPACPAPPTCATLADFSVTSYLLTATEIIGAPGTPVSDTETVIGRPLTVSPQSDFRAVATVTGTWNGTSYTATVGGTQPIGRSASINCKRYGTEDCGTNPTHSGSLPPGIDFEVDAFGHTTGVGYLIARTCP